MLEYEQYQAFYEMDCALDGVTWWSPIMLDGYSRTLLAGALVPS